MMDRKIKWLLFILNASAFLFSANFVFANPIAPIQLKSFLDISNYIVGPGGLNLFGLIITGSIIIISLGLEILFGYLFFFRNNKKGVTSLIYANLISYPIFYFFTVGINFLSVWQGEIYVVILEAVFIKLFLNEEITFKKSLFISIILNIISVLACLFMIGVIFIIEFGQNSVTTSI